MKTRDTKKYRHKGLRKNTIKTVMGEVEYVRAMYEVEEEGIKKRVYLLDEKLHILDTYHFILHYRKQNIKKQKKL